MDGSILESFSLSVRRTKWSKVLQTDMSRRWAWIVQQRMGSERWVKMGEEDKRIVKINIYRQELRSSLRGRHVLALIYQKETIPWTTGYQYSRNCNEVKVQQGWVGGSDFFFIRSLHLSPSFSILPRDPGPKEPWKACTREKTKRKKKKKEKR